MTRATTTTPPPDENRNGLDEIAAAVVKDPTDLVPMLVLADCKQIITRPDTGDRIAVMRIRRIEPISGKDADAAKRLYRKVFERRTGKNALPIEEQEEIDGAFGGGEAS